MKNIVLALALAANCAPAAHAAPLSDLSDGQTGRIEYQSITPPSMWSYARRNMTDTKQVVVWADLLMPKNIVGKVPALILSHGSSGVSPYAYEVWAKQMNEAGIAVFIVDSYKPRGIGETAQDQSVLNPSAQVADALNALKLLATHPQIDASRIYNIGFSRGGSVAFYTAWPMYQKPVDTNGVKFAGHIPVYPGNCNIRYRADRDRATAPIFMALADRENEDWQDTAVCERYSKELAAAGQPVTYKEYIGAYHGFDGNSKFAYYNNSQTTKPCDMEVQMTDVAGGGLGLSPKDMKTNKPLASYADWNASVKACMVNQRARVSGDSKQSAALVKDVLGFVGVK